MAYNFLGITNKVLIEFNEVELTSVTFSTASGFHSEVKNSVNKALQDIYSQEEIQWPFCWNELSFTTLTDGTQLYTPGASANQINWDSFYVDYDAGLEVTYAKLTEMPWQVYLEQRRFEDKAQTTIAQYSIPQYIIRRPDNKIVISPKSDKAYTVRYEAYTYPTPLSDYIDIPVIPEQYEQVILDGAEMYGHKFRGDADLYAASEGKFKEGIHQMRRNLISNPTEFRFY